MSIMKFAPTMLRQLFQKPVTKNYPAEPIRYPEGSRGHIDIRIEDCISCGACMINCPSSAITVDRKTRTWTINRFDCVQCGYCVQVCPKKCLSLDPGYQTPGPEKYTYSQVHILTEEEKKKAAEAEARKKAAIAAAMAKKKAAAGAAGSAPAGPAPAAKPVAPAPKTE